MCGRTDGLCFCSSCCFCAVWQYAYACSPFCADGLAGEGLARLRMKQSGAMLWGAKQRQCCAICRLFRKRIRLPFALRCSAAVWMHKGLCVCARQSFYWRQGLRKDQAPGLFSAGRAYAESLLLPDGRWKIPMDHTEDALLAYAVLSYPGIELGHIRPAMEQTAHLLQSLAGESDTNSGKSGCP